MIEGTETDSDESEPMPKKQDKKAPRKKQDKMAPHHKVIYTDKELRAIRTAGTGETIKCWQEDDATKHPPFMHGTIFWKDTNADVRSTLKGLTLMQIGSSQNNSVCRRRGPYNSTTFSPGLFQ